MRTTKVSLLGALAALLLVVPSAHAGVRSNTQERLPQNMYFADLDGDRSADLLQVAGNRLFAFRSDHQGSPILHEYFEHEVTRLFAGDFTRSGREHGKDQVCGLFADGALRCYAISDDGTDLWWWFSQPSFVAANEHAVVGDFDGDGADDVLVYKPSTGAVRVYTRASDGVFRPMPRFSPGNLASADLVGKKLLAGEFGQAGGRDDLLVLDPPTGRVSRFDAATDPSGTRTFWWAFDTAAGAVRETEQLSVARLDGSGRDGLVLRNRATGGLRLRRLELAAGQLAGVTGVNTGQLPETTRSGRLYFADMASFAGEPAGTVRDDALFADSAGGVLRRFDGRADGSRLTYWWGFDKRTPALDDGWAADVARDTWTVVLCRYSDVPALPQDASFWREHFTPGGAGVGDYFRDMSYGARDVYGEKILGPYTMAYTAAEVAAKIDARPQTWERDDSVRACKEAATRAGAKVPDGKVIYYLNARAGAGGLGANVVADPSLNAPTALAHEMSHAYGVNDSVDDRGNWYGDPWDVMSASARVLPRRRPGLRLARQRLLLAHHRHVGDRERPERPGARRGQPHRARASCRRAASGSCARGRRSRPPACRSRRSTGPRRARRRRRRCRRSGSRSRTAPCPSASPATRAAPRATTTRWSCASRAGGTGRSPARPCSSTRSR